MHRLILQLTGIFLLLSQNLTLAQQGMPPELQQQLRLPSGFHIAQVAEVPGARSMVWGDAGTLFVSTLVKDQVFAVTGVLTDEPRVWPIGSKLRQPNGVAFRDGDLYVAESTRILRYTDIERHLDVPPEPMVIADDLPARRVHSWKYLAFAPDGRLYVSVGAPCNVCDEADFGVILRMHADGTGRETYAYGVRNSVGFDWHPQTGEFWFTDNGRDLMGDDIPPDELNRAPVAGLHFGFPFCHGRDIAEPDLELAALGRCDEAVPPAQELGPHVAALGLAFYTGDRFPAEYHNQVFIAEHGSWNRSERIGYRVTLVRLAKDGRTPVAYAPFVEGWLDLDEAGAEQMRGRPVDVLNAPDGSLLVSDDRRGAIYRITYAGTATE